MAPSSRARSWFSIDRLFGFKDQTARKRRQPSLRPQLETLEDRTAPAVALNPTSWTPIGPAGINGGQIPGGGVVAGRVTGLAADVADSNTIFVASAGGGVWKTTNAGTSWNPQTDNLTDAGGNPIPLFMGAVAETRGAGGNEVVYAGTGEANNSAFLHFSGDDSFAGEGILVSTNGGATWTLTGQAQFQGTAISRIAIDPLNSNIAYAAVSNFAVNSNAAAATGIYKTINGGATWTNVTMANGKDSTDPWSDVVIDPTTTGNTAVLFAAVGNINGVANNGVYESIDGGATWNPVGGGMPSGSMLGRISLAIAHPVAAVNATLYASIATTGLGGTLRNLERSTDGGTTWTDIKANLNGDDYLHGGGGGQGGYDNVIEIDPTNTNEVFAAGALFNQGPTFSVGGIVESQDGGATWTDGTTHPDINTGTAGNNGPHTDYHALAFDASGNLVVGSDGGVWRLDSNDITTPNIAWTDLNSNLQITQFRGLTADPTNANFVYGGSQDNGTERFSGSVGWTQIAGGDGGITRLDPTNDNRVYQEFFGPNLRISNNAQAASPTFTGVGARFGTKVNFVAPYVLDSSGDILYGADDLNYSTNQGASFTAIGAVGVNGFNPGDGFIDAIAVSPSNIAVVYVSAGGKLFVTQNATAAVPSSVTWTEIDLPSGSVLTPNGLAVDPTAPGTAYAVVDAFTTGGKHVYMTTNFGGLWTDISGDLPNFPVDSIAVDPGGTPTTRRIYIGTDVGVYATVNGGAHWAPFATGLPNAQVTEIDILPALNIVAVATHGRGVFEIQQIPTTSVSLDGAGNLVIQDIFPGGKDDNLTIQADAATSMYVINDPTAIIGLFATIPPGATVSLDNHTAFVPFASVTGANIDVNTLGGNDKLTVDFSLGNFAKTVNYDGGTGNNNLVLEGGAFTNEVDTATGLHSGTITLDSNTVTYTNLLPIIDTATATNLTIQGTGAASETINIVNDPNGTENGFASAEVNSNDFEKMDFANKTNVTVAASSTPGTAGANVFTLDLTAASLGLTTLNLVGQGTNAFFIDSPPPAGVAVHIDGGAPGFSLLGGPDANETWNVTGPNQGNIVGVVNSFKNIQYLLGGAGNDAFVFSPGATEGIINGGYGNNTIVGAPNQTNDFYITGGNAGGIVGVLAMFGNVQNLAGSNAPGNTGTDVFRFFQSGGLAGQVMGGSGSEWLDYNSQTNSVLVNLEHNVASRVGGGVTHNPHFALNVIGSAMGGDTLIGDATGGVLEGCNTGNTIIAGSGRSILIGGYGRSLLQGNAADDLIINGTTYFDFNIPALTAILAEWQSADNFATRVYDIRVGLGQTEGFHLALNSTVFCPPSAPGPHVGRGGGNGQSTLIGAGGQNWFFTLYPTDIVDLKPTDVVD